MSNLQIYRASAGSGKTYTLTREYLKLAYEYPDKFSRILAVTFTNKAADEMKTRIIEALNEIVEQGVASGFFNEIQSFFPKWTTDKIISRSLQIRNNVLHNYSDFSVRTIDSFVQKVIRSFSFEMRLQSGYRIEMDYKKVISDLTEMLYDRISDDKNLQNWLKQFALYKMNEGKNWDFRDEMSTLASEIFKEQFQNFTQKEAGVDAAEQIERNKKLLFELHDELLKIVRGFEQKMKEYAALSVETLEAASIDVKSNGRNFTTITS